VRREVRERDHERRKRTRDERADRRTHLNLLLGLRERVPLLAARVRPHVLEHPHERHRLERPPDGRDRAHDAGRNVPAGETRDEVDQARAARRGDADKHVDAEEGVPQAEEEEDVCERARERERARAEGRGRGREGAEEGKAGRGQRASVRDRREGCDAQ